VLNLTAVANGGAAMREQLNKAVTLWAGGRHVGTRVEQWRFWSDNARPRFGTLKSALAAFDAPIDQPETLRASYFDLTLDVIMTVPLTSLSAELRLESQLGHRFRVMDKLGTVVKLHRKNATETRAALGVLDVSFPSIAGKLELFLEAALTGAKHIYRGLDHLAMIVLIAIAAFSWRQALIWASAFTLGHMMTLVAGLYGVAPASVWFVPMVELAIALSIVAAGVVVFLRQGHALSWVGLLFVGLIHGYGFAASASEALFAGQIDPMNLAAFALGLELCQFAVYALVLPLILLFDRASSPIRVNWRRAAAFGIAISASIVAISRFSETSNVFGIV
ncbi:MAG: HupE/UreJ family protein, partial [Planctomycetales bacterium]|nr:HupE/UreJ family protein [Planctomycetales bacterium]